MLPLRSYRVAGHPGVVAHVADLGLACCAVEFVAAVARGLLVPVDPGDDAPGGGDVVLVVSGTVTDALAPSVVEARDRLGAAVRVLSFGACASTGGPYWDSYSVTKGIEQLVEVHGYVPGCPPRPEALVAAIVDLAGPVGSRR